MSVALQPRKAPIIVSFNNTSAILKDSVAAVRPLNSTKIDNLQNVRFSRNSSSLKLPIRFVQESKSFKEKASHHRLLSKTIAANIDDLFNTAWDQLIGKKGFTESGIISGIGYAAIIPAISGYNFIANAITSQDKFDFSNIVSSYGLTNATSGLALSCLFFCAGFYLNSLRKEGNGLKSTARIYPAKSTIVQKLSYAGTCFGFTLAAIVLSPFILSQAHLEDPS